MKLHLRLLLFVLLFTSETFGSFLGVDPAFYEAKTDVTVDVEATGSQRSFKLTIPRNSKITFQEDPVADVFTGKYKKQAYLYVNTGSGTRRVVMPTEQLEKYFIGPQRTSNPVHSEDWVRVSPTVTSGKNQYLRMESKPEYLGGSDENAFRPSRAYSLTGENENFTFIPTDLIDSNNHNRSEFRLERTRAVNVAPANQAPNYILTHYGCVDIIGKGKTCGWVRGDSLRTEVSLAPRSNLAPDFETSVNAPNALCPPTAGLNTELRAVARNTENRARQARDAGERGATELLMSKIGTCIGTPNKNASEAELRRLFGRYKSPNIVYDKVALNKMMNLFPAQQMRSLKKENGTPVNVKDFIAMDVLARTLYAEMAICANTPDDSEYIQAVAKTVTNRAVAAEPNGAFRDFLSGNHAPARGGNTYPEKITKVALAPEQYSLWNTLDASDDPKAQLSNLRQAFCPRSSSSNQAEQIAWKHALTTAMWAVMYPEDFRKRHANIKGFLYTSNQERGRGYERLPAPVVNGRRLNDRKCMMFFTETNWNRSINNPEVAQRVRGKL